jgi:hypothetical protein
MTEHDVRMETVAMLIQPGPNPEIVVNAMKASFPNLVVIEEQPESKKLFIRRRAKKLGWVQALGQLATMVVSKYGKRFTTQRAEEIVEEFGVNPVADSTIRRVAIPSANSPELFTALEDIRPVALLLVSCRMMKAETLSAISCPVLNFHAGINPRYRGLHGAPCRPRRRHGRRHLPAARQTFQTRHDAHLSAAPDGGLDGRYRRGDEGCRQRQAQAFENSGALAAMVSSADLDLAL